MKDSLILFSNFVRNPMQIGAVAVSSRHLTKKIIQNIDFENSMAIVEHGPGLGTFTKAILKKSDPKAKLVCLEVNRKFCNHIEKNIKDERLAVINEEAHRIKRNLKKLNIKKADCVVSGLPFRNFPYARKKEIIMEVKKSLSNKGRFILFQYTNGLGKLLEEQFTSVERHFVPLNVPPSFVYVCEK